MTAVHIEKEERLEMVLRQAKAIKLISIFDCLAVFLYLIALIYPLLVLLPTSLLGYWTARRLSRALCIGQLVYLALVFTLRIVLCVLVEVSAFQAVQGILVAVTVCEASVFVSFYRLLGTLSAEEVDEAKVLQRSQGLMFTSKPLHKQNE
jgi:uncharacterized RDD family membrane protein YckC